MGPIDRAKISFSSDFPVDEVTFLARSGSAVDDRTLHGMSDAYNSYGFFILECSDRADPREDLLSMSPLFGRVTPHNRSDSYGILSVNPDVEVPGFIDSTNKPHPPHTDGAFKDTAERVTTLQCVVRASSGGTSLLGSGKLAHDRLAEIDPGLVAPLYDMDAMTITRNDQSSTKPIFKRERERITLCYRMDQTAETVIKSSAGNGARLLKTIIEDNLLRVDLTPHQILVIDNASLVHGRDGFPAGTQRRYHRLNFDGDGLLDLVHGFVPDKRLISFN